MEALALACGGVGHEPSQPIRTPISIGTAEAVPRDIAAHPAGTGRTAIWRSLVGMPCAA